MDILKLVAFGLAICLMILFVNDQNKTFGSLIRLFGAVVLLTLIIPQLEIVLQIVMGLSEKIKLDNTYLLIVLKIIGIAYVAEFGYQLCKDAGEESIASKIQLAGKVMILVVASPIVLALIELIAQLL